jgi:hypothetical protein
VGFNSSCAWKNQKKSVEVAMPPHEKYVGNYFFCFCQGTMAAPFSDRFSIDKRMREIIHVFVIDHLLGFPHVLIWPLILNR